MMNTVKDINKAISKENFNAHHLETACIPSDFIHRFVDLRDFYSNLNPISNSRLVTVLQSIIDLKTLDNNQAKFLYELAERFIQFEFYFQNLVEESSETLDVYGSNYSFGWNWITVKYFIQINFIDNQQG